MKTYNGYELNYTIAELKKMATDEMTDVKLLSTKSMPYKKLAEDDQKALKHLVSAAKLLNNVALQQDNTHNLPQKEALEVAAQTGDEHAAWALKIFNSLNGVAGLNGVDSKPITIFKGISLPLGKNFYPEDLTIDEFHKILLKMFKDGEIDEIRQILSARTMVIRHNEKLQGIDYTIYFKADFDKIANELEVAAHYCTNDLFKEFLQWQAQALIQNNPDMDMLADKHWAMMQNTPLEFTISRENYDDEMTPTVLENKELAALINQHHIEVIAKDMLGARVGITNEEGTKLLLKFKDTMPKLSALMPYAQKYTQSICSTNKELKQTMVDTDIVCLTGDYAQCRGGLTIAQNLPNNDKLSVKTGGGRRNVYHRQVRQAHDPKRTQMMLNAFLHPDFHKYYDLEALHIFVIGHENGHSLGPSSEYQNSPGICKSIIEENKADTISIAFMPEYVKQGIISARCLKQIYTTWIFRLLLRAKPIFPTETYKIIDLIEFNTLIKHQAITFDEQNLIHINFDKISPAMHELLEKVIDIQLSKSPQKAREYIKDNTEWTDLHKSIAKTHKKLGLKKYKNIVCYF